MSRYKITRDMTPEEETRWNDIIENYELYKWGVAGYKRQLVCVVHPEFRSVHFRLANAISEEVAERIVEEHNAALRMKGRKA